MWKMVGSLSFFNRKKKQKENNMKKSVLLAVLVSMLLCSCAASHRQAVVDGIFGGLEDFVIFDVLMKK